MKPALEWQIGSVNPRGNAAIVWLSEELGGRISQTHPPKSPIESTLKGLWFDPTRGNCKRRRHLHVMAAFVFRGKWP
jgi:hypothetical protein